jgi:hypothetical protein
VLVGRGFSKRAANRLCEGDWRTYPHRSLATVEAALAGRIPDPQLNVLLRHERTEWGKPINYTAEQNEADNGDRRASRACDCGGVLFDWGAGHSDGFDYINWHCNKCPDVFTEYMTQQQLYALRQRREAAMTHARTWPFSVCPGAGSRPAYAPEILGRRPGAG